MPAPLLPQARCWKTFLRNHTPEIAAMDSLEFAEREARILPADQG